MKRYTIVIAIALMAGFLLSLSSGFAEDEGTISGSAGVTVRTVDNERESAKFQEYREIPDGVSGDVELKYQKDGYFLKLKASDIGEDDQFLILKGGRYGKYRIELIYDKIPHRFAFGAKTLFAGVGSGNLVLSDALQTSLQNIGTDNVGDLDGNGTPNQASDRNIALANRLKDFFTGASTVDLELFRKTGKVNVDVMALDPFNVRVEFSHEEREGTRPIFGSFGFSNTIELAEPIDYDTTQLKLIAEYMEKPVYLNATYYLSVFDNSIDTLTFDNPFRAVDSTTATAYIQTFGAGPSKGLIDLYPNNTYHNLSFTGSALELPLKSRLSATASWGWMKQDDALVPFTSNTAIAAGAVSGVSGVPVPFDAFDRASLPTDKADAEVKTALYNVLLTSKPLNFMHVKARYRFYEYDNNTALLEIPGHVRMDAVWEPVEDPDRGFHEASIPTSFKKNTAGIDFGFDVLKATTVTIGYTFEKTERENREVAEQEDDIYRIALDTRPLPWLGLRASYERTVRDGRYDPNIPFAAVHLGEELEEPIPQLHFLRKFDEAARDRDRVQFLASVYPIDPLTITGSIIFGKDDFRDSSFGLLEDKHQVYSLDAGYDLTDRLNLYAFYSFEKFETKQMERQWSPGGTGDPSIETGLDSNSNWSADSEDKTNTFGGGVKIAAIPKKLDLNLSYSYSKSNGMIDLVSPLGTTADDTNAFTPVAFTEVDDITFQNFHAKAKYHIGKGLAVALGYMWERYKIEDFTNDAPFVPTTASGAYNAALLMDTLIKGYNVNIFYTKLTYSF